MLGTQELTEALRRLPGPYGHSKALYTNATTGRPEWTASPAFTNLNLSGWLRVGSLLTPVHTTSGFVTMGQFLVGVDADVSVYVPTQTIATFHRDSSIAGTLGRDSPLIFVYDEAIDLANANPKGSGMWMKQMLTPSANTGVGFMGIEQQIRHDTGAFNMGNIRGWAAAFEKVVAGTVTLVRLAELQVIPTAGTVTTADAAYGSIAPASGGTITTGYAFRASLNPAGTLVTGVAFDATLENDGTFTTGIGLRVNSPSVAPSTFIAIQTLGGEHRLVGNVKIGANSSPAVPLDVVGQIKSSTVINAVTGFQINGAAPSNHYPKGNGTNYVDGDFVEDAQDAVGAMVANSSKVTLTYVDATPSLTADIVAGSLGAADIANRTRTIWRPAQVFTARTGAPTLAVRGANTVYVAYDFDSAATEDVITEVEPLSDYVSGAITVKLHWTNLGAGAGNVDWRAIAINRADGGDYNSVAGIVTGTTMTTAAPAQGVKKVTTLTISFTPGALTDTFVIGVQRLGANGTDTLGNDAGMIGVELSYTADM